MSSQDRGSMTPSSPTNPFQTPGGSVPDTPDNMSMHSRRQTAARSQALDQVKNQVMINYLYQQQGNRGWRSNDRNHSEGVLLRIARDTYITHPPALAESEIAYSLQQLNVQAAMTVHSPAIKAYLEQVPGSKELPLLNGLAVQIVPNVQALARARTHQFAACVASESMLVVWDDDAMHMLNRATTIETELMQLLWTSSIHRDGFASKLDLTINEKEIDDQSSMMESGAPKPRPTVFINTILVSLSLCCIIATLGLGLRQLIIELLVEQGYVTGSPYIRFAYLAFTPIWMFFGMFFFNVLITNIAELIGPISQMNMNSKHYSAVTVPRLTRNLPHVTIQCPVYKESLEEVIMPTVQSIKQAISTYELQGGSANMFFNDDGLQLVNEETREQRIAFYADNGIGWVARPAHDASPGGFQRKGKFKKASNMNFALAVSCVMEDKLNDIERHAEWSSTDEAEATAWALDEAVKETGNIAWADGNIRVGDYILISKSAFPLPSIIN